MQKLVGCDWFSSMAGVRKFALVCYIFHYYYNKKFLFYQSLIIASTFYTEKK